MTKTKYYKFNSIFIILLYLCCCLCYGFFIDFLLNLMRYQLELTLTFRLMMTGRLGLPFTLLSLLLNLAILMVVFISYVKIFLKDMKSHLLDRQAIYFENHGDIHLTVNSICQQINLKKCLTIHLADVEFPNAFVFGFGRKRQNLVITTGLINLLNEQELRAILTHQLFSIKLDISTLATTVALISHLMLIMYDFFWFNFIYSSSRSSVNNVILKKLLRVVRFFIPISTLWFRYFLDPNTIKLLDSLTADELSQRTLMDALIKIESYHQTNHALMVKLYTNTMYNEMRRDSFIFDPAEYNYAQTIGLPITIHSSIHDRIAA